MIYAYVLCSGLCPATIIWLDGEGPAVPVALDFKDMDGHRTAALGPEGVRRLYSLPRADVKSVLERIEATARLVPCDQDTPMSLMMVEVVDQGVCRHMPMTEPEFADSRALRCRIYRQE